MKLVGKRRPDPFTEDPGAPLHVDPVPREPALLDRLADLRIARMQPVTGPVERKSVDDVGAAQATEAVLRFEQRASVAELARAGHPREAAAHDDDSPTPAHKHPPVPRKLPAFRWRVQDPMLACPQCMSEMLSSLEHLARPGPPGTVLHPVLQRFESAGGEAA